MAMRQLRRSRESNMAATEPGLRISIFMLALVSLLPAGVVGGGGEGPVLVLEPPARTFLTNSTGVTLQCAALGTPTPTITWVGAAGEPVQSQPGVSAALITSITTLSPHLHSYNYIPSRISSFGLAFRGMLHPTALGRISGSSASVAGSRFSEVL
ncbi:uncharacterized protein [Penaeus vannamei]|uniref:uncharacterized protein n=1 Tax=Penaeus vannamei TaxID=6689 RepID=UPI00387FA318